LAKSKSSSLIEPPYERKNWSHGGHGGRGGNQKGHLVEATVVSDRAEDLAAQMKLGGGLGRGAETNLKPVPSFHYLRVLRVLRDLRATNSLFIAEVELRGSRNQDPLTSFLVPSLILLNSCNS
jgi:hypothetical protein